MPFIRAASARAAAWLPEECVTTPCFFCSLLSCKTALVAPLNLKAPTLWKFSHLNKSSQPNISFSSLDVSTGVLWTKGLIRLWADWISESDGRIILYILIHELTPGPSLLCFYPKILNATVTPAMTTETIDISLISMFIAGPQVSLKGSPTVSPTILALWQSLFLPP